MPYLGKTPSQATRQRYYKTASGGETSISGTMTTGGTLTFSDGEFVDVSVNGVALVAGTDYNTTTANTIGGLSALSANDQVEIIVYDTFSVFGGNVDGDFTINNGTLTAGTTSLDGAVTINESSADVDFRVESNGNANMLFVDAGNDRIGIGTNTPAHDVEIVATAAGSVNDSLQIRNNATSSGTGSRIRFINSTDNTSDANGAAISSVRNGDDNDLVFETENSTRVTIDHAGTTTLQCSAGDSNQALLAYHPTSTSSRAIAKFQSNVGSTQADKVTIGCDGKVTIADGDLVIGTSGHGIDFSATSDAGNSASMGAELLDDYEEGSWTPTASTDSGNAASLGSVSGLYTKIGRMVFLRAAIANIDVTGSGVTSSEPLRIGGLPFTCDVSFTLGAAVSDNITLQGSRTQLNSQANTAEYITFTQSGGSQSETTTDHGDIDSTTSDIFFSIHYFSNQ